MAEIKLKLTGAKAVIALVAVVALLVLKFMTIGETKDAKLRDVVRGELTNRLGARTSDAISRLDVSNSEAVHAFTEQADPAGIEVHSTSVSKPLLPLGSSEDVVVLVEYSLPGDSRRKEYWRMKHSLVAGWRYQRLTNAAFYYLNFLSR